MGEPDYDVVVVGVGGAGLAAAVTAAGAGGLITPPAGASRSTVDRCNKGDDEFFKDLAAVQPIATSPFSGRIAGRTATREAA